MMPSQSLLDAIQAKEFVYVGENKRSRFYRKKGGVRRVSVRKFSYLSEEHSSQVKSSAKSGIVETKYETF